MSYRPSGLGTLALLEGGVEYLFRKFSSGTYEASTAPTTTSQTLDEGERTSTGKPGPGTYSWDYEIHPGSYASRRIGEIHADQETATVINRRGVAQILGSGDDGVSELAIDATGIMTASGSAPASFGTEKTPKAPWTQGLGIVIADVLYTVESIIDDDMARVKRWGEVAAVAAPVASRTVFETTKGTLDGDVAHRIANKDAVALASVNATHEWELVQLAVISRYVGNASLAGGEGASGAGEITSSATLVLNTPRVVQMRMPA